MNSETEPEKSPETKLTLEEIETRIAELDKASKLAYLGSVYASYWGKNIFITSSGDPGLKQSEILGQVY